MPNYLAGLQRPVLASVAPPLNLAPPIAEMKADEKTGETRKVRNQRALVAKGKAPFGISFWLYDQSDGLPSSVSPRPSDLMAGEGSDAIMVARKYSF